MFTFKAYTLKKNIMAGNLEPVSILNILFKISDKIHFHIKDSATFNAPCVIMLVAFMVETIGSARHFHFTDFSDFGQMFQIPIYRPSADMRVFLCNGGVDLISGGMALQLFYNFKN